MENMASLLEVFATNATQALGGSKSIAESIVATNNALTKTNQELATAFEQIEMLVGKLLSAQAETYALTYLLAESLARECLASGDAPRVRLTSLLRMQRAMVARGSGENNSMMEAHRGVLDAVEQIALTDLP